MPHVPLYKVYMPTPVMIGQIKIAVDVSRDSPYLH